jgi:hypothetical protein
VEIAAASTTDKTVSAAVLENAQAPRSETCNLRDPTMLLPAEAIPPNEEK